MPKSIFLPVKNKVINLLAVNYRKIKKSKKPTIFKESKRKEDDLFRLILRVKALEELLATDDGANLLIANRRAANIVSIEAKKDKSDFIGIPDPKVFELEEERALFAVLTQLEKLVRDLIIKEDFRGAMKTLASLRLPLDNYFENVIVNSENNNIRQNRLITLSLVGKIMNQVADFSLIEN